MMDKSNAQKFKPLWRIHNRAYRELMKSTRHMRRVYYFKLVGKLYRHILMKWRQRV